MQAATAPWWAAANMYAGDESPGQGLSTGNQTSVGALAADSGVSNGSPVMQHLTGTTAGHPVVWWFAIVVLLVIMKYSWEASGEREDFRSIRIGVWSWLVITINAVIGIAFLKWLAAIYQLPGYTQLMATV